MRKGVSDRGAFAQRGKDVYGGGEHAAEGETRA